MKQILLISKRKMKRPLSTKHPIHFILRADFSKVFIPGNHKVESSFIQLTHKCGIRVFHKSFNWNHFHSIIQIPSRQSYNSFVREWTSVISNLALQKQLGKPFKLRPYTRVASWGHDFQNLKKYHDKNNREAWRLTQTEFEIINERYLQNPKL